MIGELAVEELEAALLPGEEIADVLLGIEPEHPVEGLLVDGAALDQDLSQQASLLFLDGHRLGQRLLGNHALADQEVAEEPLRVGA